MERRDRGGRRPGADARGSGGTRRRRRRSDGVASGIGSDRYGARLIVTAGSRDEAVEAATREFSKAVAAAGLPAGPIVTVEAVSEAEDDDAGPPGTARDQARLAGRVPVRGAAAARRVDPAGPPGRVRDHVQARTGRQTGPVRGHLRRPLRRPCHRAVPVLPPARPLLGAPGRFPLEGLHLHVRGARWQPVPPGADHPRADRDLPAQLQQAAIRPVVAGRMDRRVHRPYHGASCPPGPRWQRPVVKQRYESVP